MPLGGRYYNIGEEGGRDIELRRKAIEQRAEWERESTRLLYARRVVAARRRRRCHLYIAIN